MIELHADDWFEITGRGKVAVCQGMPPGMNHPAELLGETVTIDGTQYLVRGTETVAPFSARWSCRAYDKPYGLLVKEVDGGLPGD